MAASTQGLDQIVVQIAPGASPVADPATYRWVDAGSRRVAAAIDITAGRGDEAQLVEAGSMSATMDDRNGDLSPRNVMGQWYGRLRRGTPVQVIWPRTSDDFTRAAASGTWGTNADGFTWSVTNSAYMALDGTQAVTTLPFNNASFAILTDAGSLDADVVWSFTCPVLPTGAAFVCAALLRLTDQTSYLRCQVEVHPGAEVTIKVQRRHDGVTTALVDAGTVATAGAGVKIWGRARIEGPRVLVKAWTGVRGDEPDAWDTSVIEDVLEGAQIGLLPWRLNTDVGTFTAYVDDFEVTNILWAGSVPEWPVRWPDRSGADSVTNLTGAGILRRLEQSSGTVSSPLRRQLGTLSYATGYLHCEDKAEATQAGTGLSGGLPGAVVDVTFAADDTLPGSDACLTLNTVGTSRVTMITTGLNTSGYSVMCLFRCPTTIGAEITLMEIRASGKVAKWEVYGNGSSYGFRGYDGSGILQAEASGLYSGAVPTEWVAIQLEAEVIAGTPTVTLIWHQVGEADTLFIQDTYTGTIGGVTSVVARPLTDGMSLAHLWAGDDALPFVSANFRAVANGFAGEQAAARIDRLGIEAGIPVVGMGVDSEPMGAQRSGSVLSLLRECEAADLGILVERGNHLFYRPRLTRYNRPVSMALDWSLGHLDEPPEPQDDDQRLKNSITVERTRGSMAPAQDQDSIDADGPYDDPRTINIETDDRLTDFAHWILHLGTWDELRWPRIRINLVAHPELIPSWFACTIGSRITVINPPSQITGVEIDLVIEGYTQNINVDEWIVTLTCSPAKPWDVGEWDSVTSRWQLKATTTAAEYDESDTVITVVTALNEPLSSTSAYQLEISGERMAVAIAGAAARTGTEGDWEQVVTVTRGANGVSKVLPAGSDVKIYQGGRWAL